MICYIIEVVLVIIGLLYVCFEFHYFLRMGLHVTLARFFKGRIPILQETTVKGICLTTDVDMFLSHMNNARFMRELDFARTDFWERTGLYRCIRAKNGGVAISANTIRYRRFLRIFSRFTITSKIVYWDDQSIYMEHRFITPRDNFINAIAICKIRLINCSVIEVMNELLSTSDLENGTKLTLQLPPEVEKWIESNEISSAILKNAC